MAKRFIDTGLFDDEWFSELTQDCKLFWIYYLTKCDHAGLLKYNKKLIEFQTGIKKLDTVIKVLGDRLVRVNEQLFFCPKFISFQYPGFPKSGVRQQEGAISILLSYGLWDAENGIFKSQITLTEVLHKTYGSGNDTEHDNVVKEEKLNFPFNSTEFLTAWNNWVSYRKEIKKPYRSDMSKQTALNTLGEHPEVMAIKMINKSIASGWQGLFEINNSSANKSGAPKSKLQ